MTSIFSALLRTVRQFVHGDALHQRAARASRAKYEAALEQVPDVEPDEGDRV
jgi:hypothetical protein